MCLARGFDMHLLFGLCLLPFGVIHFLPTIVACLRHSRHTFLIFLLNLCSGWTVIGWVIALILALRSEPKYVYVYPPQYRRF
jgi:Superinfection immunity protein